MELVQRYMVSDQTPYWDREIEFLLTLIGNINAPEAVTYSAIIYCLRCLISADIPLNQGCLKPIHVRIPPKSLLSPSESAAVVGGNVLTVCEALNYSFLSAVVYLDCVTDYLQNFSEPTSHRCDPEMLPGLRCITRRYQ